MEKPTTMTSTSRCQVIALTALLVGFTVACFTFVLTTQFMIKCGGPAHHASMANELRLPRDQPDGTDRMYDPVKDITVMRTYLSERCFVLQGKACEKRNVYDVVGQGMDADAQHAVYGQDVASFCDGYLAFPIEPVQTRHKRQSAKDEVLREDGGQGRYKNACQNEQLVDCQDDQTVRYTCNTGPAQIYSATVECVENPEQNQFRFTLVNRCKQFKETQKLRFIKCLAFFMQGKAQTETQEE